jgi:nucleoside-diphosphate-sugar epimerase
MKRVLVTGGSGFVGRHCLPQLLEHGYEVHAISSQRQTGDHVVWHRVDLMDHVAVASLMKTVQPTHLFHMAWITEPRRYSTALENVDWLASSLQLLRSFQQHGGKRVVMTGSCAEYDWNYGWCREDITPLKPATLYGQCKAALLSTLEGFAKQVGLSWGWGRLFFMYGPHAHPSRIPGVVIESLSRNEPARCSHGNQIRDFLHIADVASALVALVDSEVQGAVNIASGEPVTIREIVLQIADHFGRGDLVEFGAIPTAATEPPLLVADVRRLKLELGWKPVHSLASGLDATLEWQKRRLA